MRGHGQTATMSGTQYLSERQIFGLWFYRWVRIQEWSDTYHQVECEYGFRIAHFRFGITVQRKSWGDGAEPRVEADAY